MSATKNSIAEHVCREKLDSLSESDFNIGLYRDVTIYNVIPTDMTHIGVSHRITN